MHRSSRSTRINILPCDYVIWLASVAFCFGGVWHSYIRTTEAFPAALQATSAHWSHALLFWGLQLAGTGINMTSIAGSLMLFLRRFSEMREARWQAGHLLLIIYGIGAAWAGIQNYFVGTDVSTRVLAWFFAILNAVIVFLPPLAFGVLSWKWPRHQWRLCFAVACLSALLQIGIAQLTPHLHEILNGPLIVVSFQVCVIVVLVAVVRYDRSAYEERDAYHWMGVVVAIGINTYSAAWNAWLIWRPT